jgi:hypothetical protein
MLCVWCKDGGGGGGRVLSRVAMWLDHHIIIVNQLGCSRKIDLANNALALKKRFENLPDS